MQEYLHDYIWMQAADGGAPVKVPTYGDSISKAMWAGYSQCDPPKEQGE